VIALIALAAVAHADEIIYDDALSPAFYSWSWTGQFDFEATEMVRSGKYSIYAGLGPYGGLSFHREEGIGAYSALRFFIEGDADNLTLSLESTGEGYRSEAFSIPAFGPVSEGAWTEIVISFDALPPYAWNRINLVDTSGGGANFHVDDITLLDLDPDARSFTSVEPVGPDRLMVLGNGDPSDIEVWLDGQPLEVTGVEQLGAPTRAMVALAGPLHPGSLVVQAGPDTFAREIRGTAVGLGDYPTHAISPWIYGFSYPEGYPAEDYLSRTGATFSRWGGNHTSLYNPFERALNPGRDWYFLNRAAPSAGDWLSWMRKRGAATLLTVPALDRVAKDTTSYSFSVAIYGAQTDVASNEEDAGNGILTDGALITWNDPDESTQPWGYDDVTRWLNTLSAAPDLVAVGNEIDIADLTHRDVHPYPSGYDEMLARYLGAADAIRAALPKAQITGPVSCCWYYYWRSAVGESDAASHGGLDWLPWFLSEVAAADEALGERRLDYLDVHYYPEGVFNEETDPGTVSRRLRSTRSLWDPTYTDESWIGTEDVFHSQDNPHAVELIPRMRRLIDDHYPGTKLAITEWSWGAAEHLSGGLAAADVLGILGREEVEVASYWPAVTSASPVSSAYRLYRDAEAPFGDRSLEITGGDPDLAGIYAAMDVEDRVTVAVVNKDQLRDLHVTLSGLPDGRARVRHFGGALGARLVDHGIWTVEGGGLAVPAGGALMISLEPFEGDQELPDESDPPEADTGGGGGEAPGPSGAGRGCFCGGGGAAGAWWLLAAAGVARRRRAPPD